MKYLNIIQMLNFCLQKLNAETRMQVPTSQLKELQQLLIIVQKKMDSEATVMFRITCQDLMEAMAIALDMKEMESLSNTLKMTLVEGVGTLKRIVCDLAYDYYSVTDFEATAEVIPLMRDVVSVHLLGGDSI